MLIIGIIPARYASTRFPGKPLADINGKSMVTRVCEQAHLSGILADVIVATDDNRIYDHVTGSGFHAVMTSAGHPSGTDRCLEAVTLWNSTHPEPAMAVINIQGDEPFIHPGQIREVAALIQGEGAQIATLARAIRKREEIFNPDVVKVVFSHNRQAMYFSRAPIPFLRGIPETQWGRKQNHYRHIGIYGYRTDILEQICRLPQAPLEMSESLEQLRWMQNGFHVRIGITTHDSLSIDTPEDLLKITNTP